MHTIRALLVLLGCLALGETAAYLTGIKLPDSIIGMSILFTMLQVLWRKAVVCLHLIPFQKQCK